MSKLANDAFWTQSGHKKLIISAAFFPEAVSLIY